MSIINTLKRSTFNVPSIMVWVGGLGLAWVAGITTGIMFGSLAIGLGVVLTVSALSLGLAVLIEGKM